MGFKAYLEQERHTKDMLSFIKIKFINKKYYKVFNIYHNQILMNGSFYLTATVISERNIFISQSQNLSFENRIHKACYINNFITICKDLKTRAEGCSEKLFHFME